MKTQSPKAAAPSVVAVINTSEDLVEVLREELVRDGFEVVSAHIRDFKMGRQDFGTFLGTHEPDVVIYDIAIPYEDNWTFLQTLRKLPEARGPQFVVTTVNKRVLDERVGPTESIEIQGGRADDLDPVIEAVRKHARRRM